MLYKNAKIPGIIDAVIDIPSIGPQASRSSIILKQDQNNANCSHSCGRYDLSGATNDNIFAYNSSRFLSEDKKQRGIDVDMGAGNGTASGEKKGIGDASKVIDVAIK